MPTQVDPPHNLTALNMGTVEFKFSDGSGSVAEGLAAGYVDFGNIVSFVPKTETQKVEHKGSYRGVRRVDATVVSESKLQYQLKCDEWNKRTLQIVFGGDIGTPHTQAAKTAAVADTLGFTATPAVIGNSYPITFSGQHYVQLTSLFLSRAASPNAVTADATTDLITETSHGRANGQGIIFGAVALPSPLVAGVTYYVISSLPNTYGVSATVGGAAINLTTAGTTVTVTGVLVEGTDYTTDLLLGEVTILTAQAANAFPVVTSAAIVAGTDQSFFSIIPLTNVRRQGMGRLTVFDQNSPKVSIDHWDFNCEVTLDSSDEVNGTAFSNITLTVTVNDIPGQVMVRDSNA